MPSPYSRRPVTGPTPPSLASSSTSGLGLTSRPFEFSGRSGRDAGTGHACTLALALVFLGAGSLMVGCGREELAAPAPPPIEQVPAKIEEVFQGSGAEVATAVQESVASVKGDDPAALKQLQELGMRQDLTPAQRAVANQAMYSVLARLTAAATNGNTKAADAVEQYRLSK